MYARVMTGELKPGDEEKFIRMIRDRVIPRASKLRGFSGGYWLRDLESRRVLGVTLFESEQALRESEEQADRIREEASREAGIEPPRLRRYEVIASVSEESLKKAA
jgi:heme-degrading monooxygenase HmoA